MRFIKAIFFYPLLWVRRILKIILKITGVAFVLGSIFPFVAPDMHWGFGILFVVLGFLTFLLSQLYDQLLFKLNPTDTVLILDI